MTCADRWLNISQNLQRDRAILTYIVVRTYQARKPHLQVAYALAYQSPDSAR